MLNTPCPSCGQPKNPNAKQCWKCSNKARAEKLRGVKHSEERVRNIRAARQQQQAAGHRNFDLAAHMRGKPHPFAKPVGAERINKEKGRVEVKCEDGKWRYRARLVWAAAHGQIPRGRIIHHINEDPMDDRLENLQMVTRAEHAAIHSTPEVARERQALAMVARKRNRGY